MSKVGNWFKGLSAGAKTVVLLSSAFWVLVAGGLASVVTSSSSVTHSTPKPTVSESSPKQNMSPACMPSSRNVDEKSDVGFSTDYQNDATLPIGQTKVIREGVVGQRTVTYEIKISDCKEQPKTLVSDIVTKAPINKLIAKGTYVEPPKKTSSCDPNYSGCVPIASDVDCADGSGNGPAYVRGPVTVLGSDIYGLDRDGDGIACE